MLVQPPPGPLSGPSPARNRRRNPFWRFRRILFVFAIFAAVAFGGIWAFASQVELGEDNFDDLVETTYICTAEVTMDCGPDNATNEVAADGEDRVLVDYAEIPPVVIQAVVATEDKSFFDHRGVDPGGLMRAAYQVAKRELTNGTGSLQGGSTITQQYIKLATQDSADDLTRKGREIVRAVKLEQELTDELGSKDAAKQLILERYLNRVYFGRGVYGVQAAARIYFDKDIDEVTLPEAAYMAGLLRNPSRADATDNRPEADRRRSVTLGLMAEEGYITVEQQVEAEADPWATLIPPPEAQLGIGDVKGNQYGTEYFISAVRNDLKDIFPEGEYLTDGLRVYTTLDPELQALAYQTVTAKLDPTNPYMPQGALTAVDDVGRVRAMMGGTDWDKSQVNVAMGVDGGGTGFEAGSQMKVFALAEFIDQGYSPESYYAAPYTFDLDATPDGLCASATVKGGVTNDKTRATHRTVYQATAGSINTVFVQMMLDIGPSQMADMARMLGMSGEMLECPNLTLGPNPTSTTEIAGAFANIARQGVRMDPVLIEKIEDADGNVLCWFPKDSCDRSSSAIRQGEQVLDPSVARQVIGALQGVIDGGTGRAARLILPDETTRPAAGKTGTTQNNQHAWFSGFTCGMTTSVWVGYPGDPNLPTRYMNDAENADNGVEWPTMAEIFGTDEYNGNISGGKVPAELWHDFMMAALPKLPPCDELPTERPSSDQTVIGLELLTTMLNCAEPDPAVVAAQSTTTVPGETSSTQPGETTTQPPSTDTTQPAETTTTTAPPDTSTEPPPTSENALGVTGPGAGGGSLSARPVGFLPQAWLLPFNNQQPQPTQPAQTPTTEPCIPVDLNGNPIETTVPDPNAGTTPDPNAGGNPDPTAGGNPDPNATDPTPAPDNNQGGGGDEGAAPAPTVPATDTGQGNGRGNGRGRGGGGG